MGAVLGGQVGSLVLLSAGVFGFGGLFLKLPVLLLLLLHEEAEGADFVVPVLLKIEAVLLAKTQLQEVVV